MALERVQRERGELDAALITLERAIAAGGVAADYDVYTEALRTSAAIFAARGEFERLRTMLADALALGDRLSDENVTTLRMTLAAVYVETSRFDEALTIFREITPSVVARATWPRRVRCCTIPRSRICAAATCTPASRRTNARSSSSAVPVSASRPY